MRTFLFTILFFTAHQAIAQISFQKNYGADSMADYGHAVIQAVDSGYFVAGVRVTMAPVIIGEGVLMRTDKYGNEQWTRYYSAPGSTDLTFDHIIATGDGNMVLAGVVAYGGDYDAYLAKADTAGNMIWQKTYGGQYRQRIMQAKQTSDGGYILGGWNETLGTVITSFYLIKTDGNGDTVWTRSYYNGMQQYGKAVAQTSDGGYVLVGDLNQPTAFGSSIFIVKTDQNGDTAWTRILNQLNYGAATDVKALDNGHIVFTGYTTVNGCSQPFLAEMDGAGGIVGVEVYHNGTCGWGNALVRTNDNGYAIFGMDNSSDYYLIKTDSNGNQQWFREFDEQATDYGYGMQQTSDGGYVMTGITSPGNPYTNIILIKTDSLGNVFTSVDETPVPRRLAIYPNPTRDIVHLENETPEKIQSLILFDITGKAVRSYGAGARSISTRGLNAGTYLLQMDLDGNRYTERLIVR
jgi:hypothetical protein